MDKQGRLTKKSEFIPGVKYRWKKGSRISDETYEFIEFQSHVAFFKRSTGHNILILGWRNRLMEVDKLRHE